MLDIQSSAKSASGLPAKVWGTGGEAWFISWARLFEIALLSVGTAIDLGRFLEDKSFSTSASSLIV